MTFPVSLPRSRIAPPMEAPALRWGVLGSGWIAAQFIASVRAHTRQSIAAVGSRTQVNADASAHKWEIATAYGSYEALVTDRRSMLFTWPRLTTCITSTSCSRSTRASTSSSRSRWR